MLTLFLPNLISILTFPDLSTNRDATKEQTDSCKKSSETQCINEGKFPEDVEHIGQINSPSRKCVEGWPRLAASSAFRKGVSNM
jgi:hypothetical protein